MNKIVWREIGRDIFAERIADVLVNPVNCVGTSGKGLAKEFAKRFPHAQRDYKRACVDGRLGIGQVVFSAVHGFESLGTHLRFIAHLPTKRHWRDASVLADVASGLDSLVREARTNQARVVAIPALGCGNGGLAWSDVRALLTEKLEAQNVFKPVVFVPQDSSGASP